MVPTHQQQQQQHQQQQQQQQQHHQQQYHQQQHHPAFTNMRPEPLSSPDRHYQQQQQQHQHAGSYGPDGNGPLSESPIFSPADSPRFPTERIEHQLELGTALADAGLGQHRSGLSASQQQQQQNRDPQHFSFALSPQQQQQQQPPRYLSNAEDVAASRLGRRATPRSTQMEAITQRRAARAEAQRDGVTFAQPPGPFSAAAQSQYGERPWPGSGQHSMQQQQQQQYHQLQQQQQQRHGGLAIGGLGLPPDDDAFSVAGSSVVGAGAPVPLLRSDSTTSSIGPGAARPVTGTALVLSALRREDLEEMYLAKEREVTSLRQQVDMEVARQLVAESGVKRWTAKSQELGKKLKEALDMAEQRRLEVKRLCS